MGRRIGFLLANVYQGSSTSMWKAMAGAASGDDGSALFVFPGGRLRYVPGNEYLRNGIYDLANSSSLDGAVIWTSALSGSVGADEAAMFAREKAREILSAVSSFFPELEEHVQEMFATTPLSYADYTGTPGGSAYGIVKDCRNPLTSLVPARTRISNLLLTGQNLNAHGALGVTLTSALTCSEILGMEYLAKKIGNA